MPVSETAVRKQVQKLLASPQLAHSDGLTKLLVFVVEETLRGRGGQLKEGRIGLDGLGRAAESYDPTIDPIVRVQMGRLRARLRNYYASSGASDPVIIELPRGTYVPTFLARGSDTRAVNSAPRAATDGRVAVLPFVNMSGVPDGEVFSDGLTEELIDILARDGRVQVVARTSTFKFKRKARDIREIGRQLEAGRIVEGSVRQSGNRVRITAHLINVADGCLLWSARYDRELTDIFAVYDEIAAAILQAVHARLELPLRGAPRPALPTEVYTHYLQGRALWNQRTERGLRAAIAHFETAAALRPGFARAHAGLADCHVMLGMSGAEPPARCMPQARAAAQRALALDDGLAEAHASVAAVFNAFDRDRPAATAAYARARALDPTYGTARHWNALFNLATAGRFSAAIDELERAIGLDPLSTPMISDLGLIHCFADNHEALECQCARALELDPYFHRPHWLLGLDRAARGEYVAAEEALNRALELCPGRAFRTRVLGTLGYCLARSGKARPADAIRREWLQPPATEYVPRFDVAQVLAGGEERGPALAALEAAVAARESYAIFIPVWPTFRHLRDDPRFRALTAVLEGGAEKLP